MVTTYFTTNEMWFTTKELFMYLTIITHPENMFKMEYKKNPVSYDRIPS